jgi:hypothetical protein
VWTCVEELGVDPAAFNLARIVDVPAGCDTERVLMALAGVVHAHDALRTVLSRSDGGLRQTAAGSGNLEVVIHEATTDDPRTAARAAAETMASGRFGRGEWQIRATLITHRGRPRHAVVVCGHLAVDHEGLALALGDLEALMAGRTASPRSRQPLDQAAFEQSPAGQAVSARALAHMSRTLAKGPVTLFDYPARPAAPPHFHRLVMRSEAVTVALAGAAQRLRVSTAAVLLAATATVLGRHTGHGRAGLRVICANRNSDGQRDLVGTLAWDGVISLDVGEQPFDETVRKCFRASLAMNSRSHYDPGAARRLWCEHEVRLGATQDLSAHVNDMRDAPTDPVARVPTDASSLWELTRRTTVAEAPCADNGDARFYLSARNRERSTVLSLVCDTRYFAPDAMHRLLLAVEGIVTAAANGAAAERQPPELTGIGPVARGTGWVRCGDGWLDLAAVQLLWRQVTADGRSMVFLPDAQRSAGGLVGYFVAEPGLSPAGLHAAFMDALRDRTDVRAPAWYVGCDRAPEQTGDLLTWQRMTVVVEGSGRD